MPRGSPKRTPKRVVVEKRAVPDEDYDYIYYTGAEKPSTSKPVAIIGPTPPAPPPSPLDPDILKDIQTSPR